MRNETAPTQAQQALDAKGKPATLYPANSHRCGRCGDILARVMFTEFRPSLGRECSWSVLDGSKSQFWQGQDYHNACVPKAGA